MCIPPGKILGTPLAQVVSSQLIFKVKIRNFKIEKTLNYGIEDATYKFYHIQQRCINKNVLGNK
jgi:hypothetical protein